MCVSHSEFPDDPSSYVQHMWDDLLAPVTEGVTRLPTTAQLDVLTAVVTSLCDTWTAAFLKEKNKFR